MIHSENFCLAVLNMIPLHTEYPLFLFIGKNKFLIFFSSFYTLVKLCTRLLYKGCINKFMFYGSLIRIQICSSC
jgi:hypothetical protein